VSKRGGTSVERKMIAASLFGGGLMEASSERENIAKWYRNPGPSPPSLPHDSVETEVSENSKCEAKFHKSRE
jgi:hypothetical protein